MKVAVFTGTRAEYGLLYWLLKDIQNDDSLELQLIVTAMHLSPEFGLSYKQIEEDGFKIDEKIEILLSSDTDVGVAKSVGLGVIGFADALARLQPDVLVVLGDRFEALAISQAALLMGIPIAHLHGGELTEGAYDDSIRHAISKMSNIHFTAADSYQKRVIQLGESPDRVFNVGAVGLDHISRTKLKTAQELTDIYGFNFAQPFFLITYHPETATTNKTQNIEPLLKALEAFPEYGYVFTYPNADNGGRDIINQIEDFCTVHKQNTLLVKNFGITNYLSALKLSSIMIGNSSSGISEAPALKIPVVNIGDRQKGRLRCDSIIDVDMDVDNIKRAMKEALSFDVEFLDNIRPPLGMGDASQKIIHLLKEINYQKKEPFHDL